MLLLTCPVCLIAANETAFTHGGTLPPEEAGSPAVPRGIVREHWLCAAGCGSWFIVARHTASQRIVHTHRLHDPPPETRA